MVGLPLRLHEHAHRALVLAMRSAAGRQASIRVLGNAEGKLCEGQEKAEDQEQSAYLITPSLFLLL